MRQHALVYPLAAALLLAAGCQPLPEKEDEIQKTLRMIEEAKRSGRAGKGPNVFVRLERVQVSRRDQAGLAAMWRYASGRLAISGKSGLAGGGVRVGLAGRKFEAQLAAYRRKARKVSRTSEEIAVLSGERGVLWVGRDVLVPVLRLETGSGGAIVLRGVRVGARLEVTPRILPDGRIELALAPSFSVLGGDRRGRTFSISSMSTRVVLAPGQKLVLGSSSSAAEGSVAWGLFGYDARGERSATLITVSAQRL